jgi:hypothetical protein
MGYCIVFRISNFFRVCIYGLPYSIDLVKHYRQAGEKVAIDVRIKF